MPQAKRDRGYSHWNPTFPNHQFKQALPIPRLIDTRRRAAKCIAAWAAFPNGKQFFNRDWESGYEESDIEFKDDGRKMEDLEVVEIEINGI